MIAIRKVTKKYGDITAVTDLNLQINRGECFGFLGPNGAGKTTTIKMIIGLLRSDAGVIEIDGIDIQKSPEQAKRRIGYIPDKPFVYEKLTGGEYLRFIADLYETDAEFFKMKKEELLSLFSLSRWEDELVESYSHGMRQKLVITGALVHSPRVVVIDEPMVGLDPKGAQQVKQLFREQTRQGTTIFMSTHTMSTAQEMCDRIGIINKGRLIALGTMEELRKKVEGPTDLEDVFLRLTEEKEESGERAEDRGQRTDDR